MRLILTAISIIILSFNMAFSQNPELYDFNGWEFLQWSWSKKQVEEKLLSKGIQFNPGYFNQIQGPTTKFIFQNMETRLAYDMEHLYDVQQYKYFGVDDESEAKQFFTDLKASFLKKYGKPYSENENKSKKETHLLWKTKYTKVDLYFKHDENVIDGFEDQVFIISAFVNEL